MSTHNICLHREIRKYQRFLVEKKRLMLLNANNIHFVHLYLGKFRMENMFYNSKRINVL